MVEKQKVLCK